MTSAPGRPGRPQAGSTAIQQVGNLRYVTVFAPAYAKYSGRMGRAIDTPALLLQHPDCWQDKWPVDPKEIA